MKRIRVWDLPIRLFHWSLVLVIAAAIIMEKIGGRDRLAFPLRLCSFNTGVVSYFVGTCRDKICAFFQLCLQALEHHCLCARLENGMREKHLGHNPLGNLSVFALLGAVLSQAASGLFSNGDIANEGPLAKFISKELSDRFTWFHTEVSAYLIYIFIGLHIAAIAYYYFRKNQNLIKPMVSGDAITDLDALSANDSWAMRLLALGRFAVCAAGVYYLVNLQQ